MIQSNFKDWTLEKIDESFGVRQVFNTTLLDDLMNYDKQLSDFEKQYIKNLQAHFILGGDDWNEVELENKFISPLIMFSSKPTELFSYFLERDLTFDIEDYHLTGRVDGMIASGFRSPKKPYFCLNEYKKGIDPTMDIANGDPRGQALISMLVAQKLNDNKFPIYGCYIIGRNWYFMILEGKEYAISNDFSCVNEEVYDIYQILKNLNVQIEKLLSL